jgi:hypothetical protein
MLLSSVREVVSVVFSIALILFITGFCIIDLIQTKHKQDKARREREKRRKQF